MVFSLSLYDQNPAHYAKFWIVRSSQVLRHENLKIR